MVGYGYGRGPGGTCICTKCDYKESHGRGIPCLDKKCPKCGATMIRGIRGGIK
ncbi:MAG: hypothetical protein RBS85_00850 [Methanofastidiosum sp.]|jgi:hypothetical protein|nr:hypothetical protein [Methanofastidiosum sp.]